jgi:exopolysaccharide production protein ExoZ
MQSIKGLQYLRGIAALMVVFHHGREFLPSADSFLRSTSWTAGGSRGVDIFFVISGFVMAHSTRSYNADGRRASQAFAFFVKRLIRIVPLYWIALLWDAKGMIWKGEQRLELAEDFWFVPHFNHHGHAMIRPHLFQGWTINYEMFFYILFALCMLLGRRRFLVLGLTLSALTLIGVISTLTHVQTHSAPVTFYTSSFLFEFLMGIWLNLWMKRHPAQVSRAVLACVALLALGLLAVPNNDHVRGFVDSIPATMLVWSAALWAFRTELRWLRQLGDASYAIYLFHMTIASAALRLFRSFDLLKNTWLELALYLALASGLGLAVHHLIEKPLLRALRSLAARRFTSAFPRHAPGL